jgi:hypothetical protein
MSVIIIITRSYMKIMIRIKLFFINLFKHRVCDFCGQKMKYLSFGGLEFWTCEYCDNIDEDAIECDVSKCKKH